MKTWQKMLALLLAAVLLVGATFAGTVAWLTADAPDKKNVFTVGEIDIELTEETDVIGDGGTVQSTPDGAEYIGVVPGDRLVKEVKVTNTGNIPAYVALTVTVNNADRIAEHIDAYYTAQGYTEAQIQEVYDDVFENWGLQYATTDTAGEDIGMSLSNQLPTDAKLLRVDATETDSTTFTYAYANWFQTPAEQSKTVATPADGYYAADMDENQLRYTYYVLLQPNESYVPFAALNAPAYFNNAQMEIFQNLEILVEASAIQADNMTSAQDAFAALAATPNP